MQHSERGVELKSWGATLRNMNTNGKKVNIWYHKSCGEKQLVVLGAGLDTQASENHLNVYGRDASLWTLYKQFPAAWTISADLPTLLLFIV